MSNSLPEAVREEHKGELDEILHRSVGKLPDAVVLLLTISAEDIVRANEARVADLIETAQLAAMKTIVSQMGIAEDKLPQEMTFIEMIRDIAVSKASLKLDELESKHSCLADKVKEAKANITQVEPLQSFSTLIRA